MTRYHTDPTDEDRYWAREQLYGAGPDPCLRDEAFVEWLGSRLDCVHEATTELNARIIARGRALYQAYRQEPK